MGSLQGPVFFSKVKSLMLITLLEEMLIPSVFWKNLEENYKTFNESMRDRDHLMTMNSPWFLLCDIATNANGQEEPYMLSCRFRSQAGHYCIIESAGDKSLIFLFTSKKRVAVHFSMKPIGKGWSFC